MRVRMLQTHEAPTIHREHGALTLRYPARTTQHFDEATALELIAAGKAEANPDEGGRVTMLRTVIEGDVRFTKGAVVHVGADRLAAWLKGDADGPVAELTPDTAADFVQATADAATEDAIARATDAAAAAARRAAMTQRAARPTKAPDPASGAPAAIPSSTEG